MPNQMQTAENTDEQVGSHQTNRPVRLSISSICIGLIALAMAAIPPYLWDRPIELPFNNQPKPEPKTQHEGGMTLKFKSLSLTMGGKEVPVKEEPAPAPTITSDPIKWFTIAAISAAILSMLVAAFAQAHEKHTVLTTSAVSLAIAAIAWQYIIIGLCIGAAVAVLLVVLSALGGTIS